MLPAFVFVRYVVAAVFPYPTQPHDIMISRSGYHVPSMPGIVPPGPIISEHGENWRFWGNFGFWHRTPRAGT